MEVRGESQSGPSCSSSSRDGSGVSVSKELLMAGSGGRGGDGRVGGSCVGRARAAGGGAAGAAGQGLPA